MIVNNDLLLFDKRELITLKCKEKVQLVNEDFLCMMNIIAWN